MPRQAWIDLAKVLGIWLVVLGHMPHSSPALKTFIFSFHMPLFFFISGYLAKPKPLGETVKQGGWRLLLPYLLYGLISWAWWLALAGWRQPSLLASPTLWHDQLLLPGLGLLYGVGYSTSQSAMTNPPLWFLVGLFVVSVVFAPLAARLRLRGLWVATATLALVPWVLAGQGVDLLFSIDSALMALPLYVLGHSLARAAPPDWLAALGRHRWGRAGLMLACLAATLAATAANGRVDINELRYGAQPALFYLAGAAGTAFAVLLAQQLAPWLQGRVVQLISSGTLVILALHGLLLGPLLSAMRLLGLERGPLQDAAATAALVLAFVPVIVALQKWAPVLVGRAGR